jgi:hypothetical protein
MDTIQRRATDGTTEIDDESEQAINSRTSGGRPLPERTREYFEPRFGRDFGDVRVHTGPQADEAARSIDATAFTLGTDIVFKSGSYRPGTSAGRKLLAHELTHVVQQNGPPQTNERVVQRQVREERERRTERGMRRDERRERTDPREGERSGLTQSIESDWAGRAILERYLRGGGDWEIRDDPNWAAYTMANEKFEILDEHPCDGVDMGELGVQDSAKDDYRRYITEDKSNTCARISANPRLATSSYSNYCGKQVCVLGKSGASRWTISTWKTTGSKCKAKGQASGAQSTISRRSILAEHLD